MIATPQRQAQKLIAAISAAILLFAPGCGRRASVASASAAQADTCTMDADGTAHITRVIPVPQTISPEAQKFISHPSPTGPELPLAELRANTDKSAARAAEARKLYPVDVKEQTMGGVRCAIISPLKIVAVKRDRVLINLHGGGFFRDTSSLIEGIPVAYLTGTTVVCVYYRLAPEHPFPAAVDDAEAVYKELLKTHQPGRMGLYGTSAGAILTAEVAVRLKRDGLPLPAALGVFSGTGDMNQPGDSMAFFTGRGLGGNLQPPRPPLNPDYVGSANPKDPVLSPMYADLEGFPPTLLVTSTRDLLLSGTANLHRALLRAGVDAELVVFDALPHAFWNHYDLPESKEALDIMAKFFDKNLGG